MKVTHMLIFGYVQEVGFRKYVYSHARKLGLTGWVRNVPEGIRSTSSGQAVEVEVAGQEEAIGQLIQLCKRGPFLANVLHVEVGVLGKDFPYKDFVIRKGET